ncbi:MAG: UvrD-helicase domain-containing protein [Actinophytocola sp.]
MALLARTAEGWRLFIRRDLVGSNAAKADAFLIGHRGVVAVSIVEKSLDESGAQAIVRHAGERCAGIRSLHGQVLSVSAINFVAITPVSGGEAASHSQVFWSLTEQELPRLFQRDAVSLDRRQIDTITGQLTRRLPEYLRLQVQLADRGPGTAELFDTEDLAADQLAAAQERPFETWLTFLHPHQQALVTRDYRGPARISGPAGTGKTVVVLHRLRYLARRSVGPLLFTTLVRTVPPVHQKSFRRLAPELTERVEFVNLHAWIRGFLRSRGSAVVVHSGQVNDAFSRAWLAHRTSLQDLEPTPGYWQTEIDRVIKGRGLRTLDEYVRVSRRGRSLRLDAGQRTRVWRLYEAYQRNLADKQLVDHNDMIGIALDELTARPLAEPYAAVVVDEVQDITLSGLRLLRTLGGDGPNALLLVGDGQQQVYPGGWRLSDAGIPVQGRGEVLRVNYRNRTEVLGFAQRFAATNQVDDLDGAAGVALRDAEPANPGGTVRSWRGSERDLPDALVAAINELPVPRGQAAVIVFHHRDLDRCTAVLRRAGIPLLQLEHYEGELDDKVKIGTVHRAKGLDFRAVLAIQSTADLATGRDIEQEVRESRERQYLVAATRARDFLWWGVVDADRVPRTGSSPFS